MLAGFKPVFKRVEWTELVGGLNEGQYDAIILAAAGLIRLGLQEHITQYLPFKIMMPAPGQGALAVQCVEKEMPLLVDQVVDWTVSYVDGHLASWIIQNGDWVSRLQIH